MSDMVRDEGFENLSQGTLGNAGHNLYVSRAGVLQRIQYSDINGDGYVDLPFANSHDDDCRVPAYLYLDPLHGTDRVEIPTEGAFAGAIGDLTGDGHDDLVIANQFDGAHNELHAQVYFGGPDGWSRKRMLGLWAPSSKDVEIGDFTGTGHPWIVLVSRERLRVFYPGTSGFTSRSFMDLDLPADIESITVADLDGDGADDLIVRSSDSSVRVYWGGVEGIDPDRSTLIDRDLTGTADIGTGMDAAAMGTAGAQPSEAAAPGLTGGDLRATGRFVYRVPDRPRLRHVQLAGRQHLFLCRAGSTVLVSFDADRTARPPVVVPTGAVYSAAVGDIRGCGVEDLVVVSRRRAEGEKDLQQSWIYWGSECGWSSENRTGLLTRSANDVVLADLSGSGRQDVIVCQDMTTADYSTESLVFRATANGVQVDPRRLPTSCALDVLLARDPHGGPVRPVFINHLSNSARGHIASHVYLGGPDGFRDGRRLDVMGWAATEMTFVDLTDNGRPDIVVSNANENDLENSHGCFVYWQTENGLDLDRPTELPTDHTMSCVVADFDQDGYLDLVTAGFGHAELLHFRGSARGFGEPERIPLVIDGTSYDQPRYMSTADLDGNGWLDLVIPELGASGGGVIILWGGPGGFSAARSTILPSGTAVSSRVADLDGDGWPDLVVGGFKGDDLTDGYRTGVFIYWGGPEGFSNHRRTELPAYFPADVAVADLNNDGILDIVASNYHGGRSRDIDSYIYWGAPGGHFSPGRMTRLFHHSACGALAADFDEDGWVDLAVANHKTRGNHPGMSYVWWNGPQGLSPDRRTSLPTAGPHGLTHTDLGNVLDRGPEEFFESRIITLHAPIEVLGLQWHGVIPAKTWVTGQVRAADTVRELAEAEWVGGSGPGGWLTAAERPTHQVRGRVVQYRLALGAFNSVSTPRITAVDIHSVKNS